jgi:hypothetical protein
MRAELVLIAAFALNSCGRSEATKALPNEQERMQRWYKEWSARQPRPTPQLVDHIEALLAQVPCIGDLNRWSRSYGYNMLPEKSVDTGIVDFHLEEAGTPGVKPGRHITAPDSWVNLDDRPIKMAEGDYDLKEDRMRVGFCGNNVIGPGAAGINNMNSYFDELKRRRKAHGT